MRDARSGFLIAVVIFLVDQLTNWIVTGALGLKRLGDQLVLLPILDLTYTENNGISLGLLNATNPTGRWMLVALTSAIAIAVGVWITREKNRTDQIALGLVLGGALGNILDRVRFGYVVDFADLHFPGWPEAVCWSYSNGACRPFLVFNIADAAISIGVVVLLLRAFLTRKESEEASRPKEIQDHA
jgi:signal peptidase II